MLGGVRTGRKNTVNRGYFLDNLPSFDFAPLPFFGGKKRGCGRCLTIAGGFMGFHGVFLRPRVKVSWLSLGGQDPADSSETKSRPVDVAQGQPRGGGIDLTLAGETRPVAVPVGWKAKALTVKRNTMRARNKDWENAQSSTAHSTRDRGAKRLAAKGISRGWMQGR